MLHIGSAPTVVLIKGSVIKKQRNKNTLYFNTNIACKQVSVQRGTAELECPRQSPREEERERRKRESGSEIKADIK